MKATIKLLIYFVNVRSKLRHPNLLRELRFSKYFVSPAYLYWAFRANKGTKLSILNAFVILCTEHHVARV